MTFALPPIFQDRFSAIIRSLCIALAVRANGPNPLPHPLFFALHNFISRRSRRFANLVARVRAGLIPRRTPATRAPGPTTTRTRSPTPYISRRRGWLLSLMQPAAAAAHGHLRHLIAEPDMAELIACAPSLGRILRPLAHMLAIDLPPALQRPPKPTRQAKPTHPQSVGLPPEPAQKTHALPSRRPSLVTGRKRLPGSDPGRIVFADIVFLPK